VHQIHAPLSIGQLRDVTKMVYAKYWLPLDHLAMRKENAIIFVMLLVLLAFCLGFYISQTYFLKAPIYINVPKSLSLL
jgi:hypothetical protein